MPPDAAPPPSWRWYAGLAPVDVPVLCGGELHRVSLRRGRVVLGDHRLSGERALAALGGRPCACMALLAAWPAVTRGPAELVDDLRPAVPGAPRDLWVPPAWLHSAQWVARPPGAARSSLREHEAPWALALLRSLPGPARAVAACAAVVGAERRWDRCPEPARERFASFLGCQVRAAAAAVTRGRAGWRAAGPPPRGEVASRGEQPSLAEARPAGTVIRVPLSWLVTVWARGLAAVDGALVLAARGGPDRADVDVVRWGRDRAVRSTATAERDAGGRWRLR